MRRLHSFALLISPFCKGWVVTEPGSHPQRQKYGLSIDKAQIMDHSEGNGNEEIERMPRRRKPVYDLGIGKNRPVEGAAELSDNENISTTNLHWNVPESVQKPSHPFPTQAKSLFTTERRRVNEKPAPAEFIKTRRMIAQDQVSQQLRRALWDELHYTSRSDTSSTSSAVNLSNETIATTTESIHFYGQDHSKIVFGFQAPPRPLVFYPNVDLSVPDSVYSDDGSIDLTWDLLRWEAFHQAQQEPLLVSFLHSTILNHKSLESSLAFLLANRLQSTGMIATQLQSIIMDSLQHSSSFRRNLRADLLAVRDRDPACNCLPDAFLYFKGYHALQTHRVAHYLYSYAAKKKTIMAKFLQSQVSKMFQIDIHPNADLGSGIMLDHGTGIVIGETSSIGHNCSILHHVTLGGSGKKGVKRHPTVGDGVLLGAGATVLGPVTIGEGTQIGAGTLVISDLPSHSVAVGVPARIVGRFVDVTQQPSISMDQTMSPKRIATFESEGI